MTNTTYLERSLRRCLFAAGLLVIEGVLLGIRFDAESLSRVGGAWWAGLLSQVGVLPQIAIAAVTAAALIGGKRIIVELRRAVATANALAHSRRTLAITLLGHVVALTAFFFLSTTLFETDRPADTAHLLVWLVAGSATVATLAAAALPPAALWVFARATGGLFALAAAAGTLAWGAGYLTAASWELLREGTLGSVYAMLSLAVDDAIVDPEAFVVGTDRFWVIIAKECSGYQGIGLIWAFLAIYLWSFRDTLRFPQAFLLLPIATAAAWSANLLRIAALVLVGTWGAPEIALGGFHSYMGSLLFCAVALVIAHGGHRSRFFSDGVGPSGSADEVRGTQASAEPSVRRTPPTAAYIVPLLAIFVTAMVTGAASSGGFDIFYPLRVLAAGACLLLFRRAYGELRWDLSWPPIISGLAVFVLWLALEPTTAHAQASSPPSTLLALPPGLAAAWLGFRVVGSVVTVPLAEELAFRGYMIRRLAVVDFERLPLEKITTVGLIVSSVAFGAMHDRILAGTLAGIAYGLVARHRGRLGDAVVAHATTNLVLALYAITTGSWSIWI